MLVHSPAAVDQRHMGALAHTDKFCCLDSSGDRVRESSQLRADVRTRGVTMRKIVSSVFLSLDGVMESPEKWHFPYFNDEMGAVVGSQMADSDGMLLGRVTWQEFAGFWPEQG